MFRRIFDRSRGGLFLARLKNRRNVLKRVPGGEDHPADVLLPQDEAVIAGHEP